MRLLWGGLDYVCLAQIQVDHLLAKIPAHLNLNRIHKRAAAPVVVTAESSSFFPGSQWLIANGPLPTSLPPSRLEIPFLGRDNSAGNQGSGESHSITTESPVAKTFQLGFAVRSDAATLSEFTAVPLWKDIPGRR